MAEVTLVAKIAVTVISTRDFLEAIDKAESYVTEALINDTRIKSVEFVQTYQVKG